MRLSNTELHKLADRIRDKVFSPLYSYKTSIFLCGSSPLNKDSGRQKVASVFEEFLAFFYYEIIYPEDLFIDLLSDKKNFDLLSLENMLAESVDAIIVLPESPGSFVELGAFTNNSNLARRVICIQDAKYKKDKSFINSGPLRILRSYKNGQVVFVDFKNIEKYSGKIRDTVTKIKKLNPKKTEAISLLQLEYFILPCIYLLEPVEKQEIITLVAYATGWDSDKAYAATTISLSSLSKRMQIVFSSLGFRLTQRGIDHFQKIGKRNKKYHTVPIRILDDIRTDILTITLRNKEIHW